MRTYEIDGTDFRTFAEFTDVFSRGETLFDMLIAIIREHGPTGRESEDRVLIELL